MKGQNEIRGWTHARLIDAESRVGYSLQIPGPCADAAHCIARTVLCTALSKAAGRFCTGQGKSDQQRGRKEKKKKKKGQGFTARKKNPSFNLFVTSIILTIFPPRRRAYISHLHANDDPPAVEKIFFGTYSVRNATSSAQSPSSPAAADRSHA